MTDQPTIDGLAPAVEPPSSIPSSGGSKKAKVLVAFAVPYILYILWCVFLLSILPNASGEYDALIPIGTLTSIIGGLFLLLITGFILNRVFSKETVQVVKLLAVGKTIGVLIPGIAVSAFVPYFISQEPGLSMDIIDPSELTNLTAPLTITYSLEGAAKVLQRRNLNIVNVQWDFDGDGEPNEETIDPIVTAIYEQKGVYTVIAHVLLSDNTRRRISRRLLIPEAVFSVFPLRPLINEPVTLSVAHLLTEEVSLKEASWDFDSDGEYDEITSEEEVSYTFLRAGKVKISAVIALSNQTQIPLEKEILVSDPPPLPFEVSIETEPKNLVGPSPFGVLFSINTNEPYEKIAWNLGDGKEATGERVGHTFEKNGNYYITADVYSVSGAIARVSKTVRVVDVLRLPDLTFEGSHEVRNRKVSAEVPLTVEIIPKTSQPLITFSWEASNASSVESTDTIFRASYRRPGTYSVTLIATGPSGNVLRLPVTLEVLPQTSSVDIRMVPDGGVAPLQVRFDASETVIQNKEITGFEWKFGADVLEPIQGGAQIEYLFEEPGTYRVLVTAFTTSGETFSTERTIVVRAPVLDACFTTSRITGKAPLGVSFDMGCTTGLPDTILWDFGDGATTDEKNPIHVFERAGVYTVKLRLQDDQGTTSQETLTITAKVK